MCMMLIAQYKMGFEVKSNNQFTDCNMCTPELYYMLKVSIFHYIIFKMQHKFNGFLACHVSGYMKRVNKLTSSTPGEFQLKIHQKAFL